MSCQHIYTRRVKDFVPGDKCPKAAKLGGYCWAHSLCRVHSPEETRDLHELRRQALPECSYLGCRNRTRSKYGTCHLHVQSAYGRAYYRRVKEVKKNAASKEECFGSNADPCTSDGASTE